MFADEYGLTSTSGLVDAVIDMQQELIGLVHTLAEAGRQPQTQWVADGHLDELNQRLDWTRTHRHLFE
ncbi:hypothetical protein [Phytoactinopolyspora halotolerans]|uniref:Uncharacterized protein n=1 Tax=Phytoactinopolyspora halotolerans TaxID=1981512 RepID=A0A6L9S3P6_9ACTN|nr:hypothetical protein [Phytoactinopolyspora halotolerans]NED99682.1 hypothetical protein [Phytoactinopolyspora halotolerans]